MSGTFTMSSSVQSVSSPPSTTKPKELSFQESMVTLKSVRSVGSTMQPPKEVNSAEFLDLEEEVSHFDCHPFDIGLTTRKPDIPEAQQENLLPKDNFAPFKLVRVCGRLREVPAINLTNGLHKNSVLYAASNAIVLLDFFRNTQRCFQGHKNMITTLVTDHIFNFLISGDSGKDCSMIIWDMISFVPVKLFPSPHDGSGIINAAFAGTESLFATVGAEDCGKQRVCMWNFDHKDTKLPLSSCDLPQEAGIQKVIVFCEFVPNYFATYGDVHMLFYTYNKPAQTIYVHKPKVPTKFIARMKRFTGGLWMNEDKWFVTTTMLGYAIVWEKPMGLGLKKPIDPTKNIKEYKRSFKLSDHGITCFHKYKSYLVAGDEKGILRFFDESFKIVRWTPTIMMSEPVTSVSFNLTEHIPHFVMVMNSHYTDGEKSHIHHEGNSIVVDYSFGGRKRKPLSETSIERSPLNIPDFTLCTDSGSLYYCHFMEGKVDMLVPGAPAPWVAMDVCPNTPHVVFVTKVGDVHVYDYEIQKLNCSKKVFRKNVSITVLKFHPLGELAFFGAQDGRIYLRHNYTWMNVQAPLMSGSAAILKMTFSVDGSFMACSDANGLIALYHFDAHRSLWANFGKNIPHTKEIVDLKFSVDKATNCNRFFSLGADRRLIEYDLYEYGSGVITILKTFFVEQTCIPTSMTFVCPEEFGDHCVLIHNKINKFRIFDYEQGKVMKTCQGPLFGGEKIQKLIRLFPTVKKMNTNMPARQLIIFFVDNKLGLITTPVDGNPNRYMAVLAHPENILDACVSLDQKYVFTIGKNDKCVYCWEPEVSSAEAAVLLGGAGISPFTHILKRHWPQQDIIKDIDLIIFHLNLKRVQTQSEMISMPKTVKLNEIAAVCRTCGFFLTEYEIDVMLTEAIFMIHLRLGNNDQITFEEFIKMFANHFYRTSHDDVQWAFSVLGKTTEDDGLFIPGEWFLHYMCARGEPMPRNDFDELFGRILKRLPAPSKPVAVASSGDLKKTATVSVYAMDNATIKPDNTAIIKDDNASVAKQESTKITLEPQEPVESPGVLPDNGKQEENSKINSTASIDESSLLAVPRRIDLLKFLDAMFPLNCQDAMKVEGKDKDDNRDLQKIATGRMYKSQIATARAKARQNKRYFVEKTNCLLTPENPLYEKLLCAFEAQIFELTGKSIGRQEIAAGARAFLHERGPLMSENRKKKDSKGSAADSDSESGSSKKGKSEGGDEPVDEEVIQEEEEEEMGEEEEEELGEEEFLIEEEEIALENLNDMAEDETHIVEWTDPIDIVTTEDETWLNEDIEEGTQDELELQKLQDLNSYNYQEVPQPGDFLSLSADLSLSPTDNDNE